MAKEKIFIACSLEYEGCGSTPFIIGTHRTRKGANDDLKAQYAQDLQNYDPKDFKKSKLDESTLYEFHAVSGFLAGNVDEYTHTYYYIVEKTLED